MTIKTETPELTKLKNQFKNVQESPWAVFNDLDWNDVITTFNDSGYENAKELIERSDTGAFHKEEAANGYI